MEIKKVTTDKEREDAFSVRTTVFIEEQNVPVEEEMDEHDETAIHFVGYEDDLPVAASRVRFVEDYGKLERICVLKEHRGKHFGKQLMKEMEQLIQDHGYRKAKLHAQTHAQSFYAEEGYETISDDVFMDAGIPHVAMLKKL